MYDKAQTTQLINARQLTHPDAFSGKKIQLPHPDEIPHIDIEVINFHKPLLGSEIFPRLSIIFHANITCS